MPFTAEEFLSVFARYNEAVWPGQLLLIGAGLDVVIMAIIARTLSRRIALALLGALWLWAAVFYHLAFFSRINPAAFFFAALFATNGCWLLWIAARGEFEMQPPSKARIAAAAVVVIYALVLYPAIGYLAGLRYPATPTFGVPCPTTIFTLGVLLLLPGVPRITFVIPVIWALIGSVAAFRFNLPQDYGLLFAAAVALTILRASAKKATVGPVAPMTASA